MQPNLAKVTIIPENIILEPNTKEVIYHLRPNGYLIGIAVNPMGGWGELKCNLQDYLGNDIDNTTFNVQMAMTSGGIVFEKPLINMSSRDAYRLKIVKLLPDSPPIPNMTIYPIGCWDKK